MNTTSSLDLIHTHTGLITESIGPFTLASDPLVLVDDHDRAWEPTFTTRPNGQVVVDLVIVSGNPTAIKARRNLTPDPLPVLTSEDVLARLATVLDRCCHGDAHQKTATTDAMRLIGELTAERDEALHLLATTTHALAVGLTLDDLA